MIPTQGRYSVLQPWLVVSSAHRFSTDLQQATVPRAGVSLTRQTALPRDLRIPGSSAEDSGASLELQRACTESLKAEPEANNCVWISLQVQIAAPGGSSINLYTDARSQEQLPAGSPFWGWVFRLLTVRLPEVEVAQPKESTTPSVFAGHLVDQACFHIMTLSKSLVPCLELQVRDSGRALHSREWVFPS